MEHEFHLKLNFEELSLQNWALFEELFGTKGACGGCWCMSFRLQNKVFEAGKLNGENKNGMKQLISENKPGGILAFYEGKAIAWCAFDPREDFVKLENSRVHKRIDDREVWSIPCFYISKAFRKKGVSVELLKAVIQFAKKRNINIIEAYPAIPTQDKLPDTFAWIGLYKSFERAGFQIVDRTSKNRPMVRYYL